MIREVPLDIVVNKETIENFRDVLFKSEYIVYKYVHLRVEDDFYFKDKVCNRVEVPVTKYTLMEQTEYSVELLTNLEYYATKKCKIKNNCKIAQNVMYPIPVTSTGVFEVNAEEIRLGTERAEFIDTCYLNVAVVPITIAEILGPFTVNGDYSYPAPEGQSFSSVSFTINVQPRVASPPYILITQILDNTSYQGFYTYNVYNRTNHQYDYVSEFNITNDLELDYLDEELKKPGSYNYTPSSGYYGYEEVDIYIPKIKFTHCEIFFTTNSSHNQKVSTEYNFRYATANYTIHFVNDDPVNYYEWVDKIYELVVFYKANNKVYFSTYVLKDNTNISFAYEYKYYMYQIGTKSGNNYSPWMNRRKSRQKR